jgi:hypothetical protein
MAVKKMLSYRRNRNVIHVVLPKSTGEFNLALSRGEGLLLSLLVGPIETKLPPLACRLPPVILLLGFPWSQRYASFIWIRVGKVKKVHFLAPKGQNPHF